MAELIESIDGEDTLTMEDLPNPKQVRKGFAPKRPSAMPTKQPELVDPAHSAPLPVLPELVSRPLQAFPVEHLSLGH